MSMLIITVNSIGNELERGFTENTKPPTPIHASPADEARLYGNSQIINWTAGGTDAESDTITYYWRIGTLDPPTDVVCSDSTTSLYSSACLTTDGVPYYWDIVASDGYENQTITSTWNFTENSKPSITSVNITPSNPVNSDDLNCTVTGWSDTDGDSAQYYFSWYNNSVLVSHNLQSGSSHVLGSGNLSNNETWNCSVTPYDGYENGTAFKWDSVSTLNPHVELGVFRSYE